MPKQLSKEEIDTIYNKFFAVKYDMLQDIRSSNFGILMEHYLQQLIFCLFVIPILIKNELIVNSNNKKISLSEFINLLKESGDLRKDFFQIFKAFKMDSERKEFKISNWKLQVIINQKYDFLNSKITYKEISNLNSNWYDFFDFYISILEEYNEKVIEVFSTIYERGLDQLADISDERRKKGVYYTPPEITSYMNEVTIFLFLSKIAESEIKNLTDFQKLENKEKLLEIHKKLLEIKILDPACGSGDFLIHSAQLLCEIFITLNEKLQQKKTPFEIKKSIIEKNLFGVDLIPESISFTKARLFLWCIMKITDVTEIINLSERLSYNLETGNSLVGWVNEDLEVNNEQSNINHKFLSLINKQLKEELISIDEFTSIRPFHWKVKFRKALESGGFDIIIGNPPYIEIKKFKNPNEKKIFSKIYSSAFKLYDISILFIERGFQLLKENGFFSFILTNKLVSNDSSERIRKLLLTKTKLQSIIDVSYIPVFKEAATYPIIITFQKNSLKPETKNLENSFNVYPKLQELIELTQTKKAVRLTQQDFYDLPRHKFELTGSIDKIQEMRNASKHQLGDLGTFSYRLLGFTDWVNVLDNLSQEKQTEKDLKFIGTTNVYKYAIHHKKTLTVAKRRITSMYLPFQLSYKKAWTIFTKPKLIVKEVAKNLTVSYDPGLFANATGMYSFSTVNQTNIKLILLILNSEIMNEYFSALYSGTHLAGGYFRYNGSYLKELPIINLEKKEQIDLLTKLADYLLFLNQVQIDLEDFFAEHKIEVTTLVNYYSSLANELVENMYLKEKIFLKMVRDYTGFLKEIPFDKWLKIIITSDDILEDSLALTNMIYEEIYATYQKLQKK